MRKTFLVVASVALAMVVLGGVAWAATIQCPNSHLDLKVPLCIGTDQDDTLRGTNPDDDKAWVYDRMNGMGGADTLYGYGGGDSLGGGSGSDSLFGGRESDTLYPNSEYDTSTDYVHGGRGGDFITTLPPSYGGSPYAAGGVDRVYGERGNDTIFVSPTITAGLPKAKAIVDCGPGREDRVKFELGVDVVKENCEIRQGRPRP